MVRPLRINVENELYHVTIRGNHRQKLFLDDEDREKYLETLKKYKKKYEFKVYCFVLMLNHVHLLVEPSEKANLSKMMQVINTSYAMYFNKKYRQVGHVQQGRFHSILVERESYLLELTRYIHLNPVRAGIVANPREYADSSFPVYMDVRPDGLVDKEEVLELFGVRTETRIKRYRAFVEDGIGKRREVLLQKKLKENIVLGREKFRRDLLKQQVKEDVKA